MAYKLNINGKTREVDVDGDMPLLWVLRDELNLTGTKFGCGIAQCGACTIHLDGEATRACITPVSSVEGAKITTIEGISASQIGAKVQAAWLDVDVMQCGYCQAGQIMAATALLSQTPKPTDAQIDEAMEGNICRCATYARIRQAIKQAAGMATADTREV
ncbi:(2Fe-2S)-binding protein [Asticcacaulis sp. AC402]|uniref:(2Fe-2S)-binding protein n=1 Tax=Asticcacaulis sp. AC402 TaxID=1282361 RepID=UPI0003C3BA8F|nr:(2Fe-2S)-binding protein [Asticcacaulis sp. AC402]ESQ77466.1 (2Fe-2S)-binding protein [Asticcacaulis sp. AC402]